MVLGIFSSVGVAGERGGVTIPSWTDGYGEDVVRPGGTGGYGDPLTNTPPVRIPDETSGYGQPDVGGIHIPEVTRGYGDGSGTVRIPDYTTGYGTGPSGTVHIPEHTAGYGEAPSGTVHIPGQTTGYGESGAGPVHIPGFTDGYGGTGSTRPFEAGPDQRNTGPSSDRSHDTKYIIRDVSIVDINTGRTVHLGDVDLRPALERIRRGERASHRNDGAVFQNRERNLPRKKSGYYREYVVPTPGVRGVGPQRLVLGDGGEVYYSSDHYDSFLRIE